MVLNLGRQKLVGLLLFIATAAGAQQSDMEPHDLKFSIQIEEEIKKDSLRKARASYYYTYIGKYRQALETYELTLDFGLDSITSSDSIEFVKFKPANAFEYLSERTKHEQLVIISEAHQKPQHRIFTANLLQTLYRNGFRYLGIECLMNNWDDTTKFLMDTALNERGYPLNNFTSGTYTREPRMAHMIRKAIDIGFELFSYERNRRDGTERDLQQAQNVERFMRANPEGKVALHCGWYHAVESPKRKRRNDYWLAYLLKQKTGIDPLTIYQDGLSERGTSVQNPYYNLIKATEVSVLVHPDGQIFNGFDKEDHFDIMIYHPPTQYHLNRPHWLTDLENHHPYNIRKHDLSGLSFPIIVRALSSKESLDATPYDIIELADAEDDTPLILPKGDYLIELINIDGSVKTHNISVP